MKTKAGGEPVMAGVDEENGIAVEDAWPPFEDMARGLDEDKDQKADPSLDIAAPDVSQHSLMEAREAAIGKEQATQEQINTVQKAKEAIVTGRAWDQDMQRDAAANIRAMMKLIEPALRAEDAEGTEKQKVSYICYWTTFCAAYGVGRGGIWERAVRR